MDRNPQDLESILRILREDPSPQSLQGASSAVSATPATVGSGQVDIQELLRGLNNSSEASTSAPPAPQPTSTAADPSRWPSKPDRRQQERREFLAAAPKITRWAPALKHVNKMGADPQFAGTVEKMIIQQKKHEQSWWDGREELIRKQTTREESVAQLNDVFRAIGSLSGATSRVATEEEKAAELATYDQKVYRASREMANSMSAELGRMGTPFFCIDSSLITPGGRGGTGSAEVGDEATGISEDELMKLKRRLLEHLTDLYGDS